MDFLSTEVIVVSGISMLLLSGVYVLMFIKAKLEKLDYQEKLEILEQTLNVTKSHSDWLEKENSYLKIKHDQLKKVLFPPPPPSPVSSPIFKKVPIKKVVEKFVPYKEPPPIKPRKESPRFRSSVVEEIEVEHFGEPEDDDPSVV